MLKDLRRQSWMTGSLRRSIDVTLLHFPDDHLIELLVSSRNFTDWLQPERSGHG
jgi:hypothetical protein